ncbi:MAG: polysaccharide deacetylase family protein [Epsilonproteobacteria bacterium]|nr:polysaccharide deacetylase family protein [Campylobacterota bacterium]
MRTLISILIATTCFFGQIKPYYAQISAKFAGQTPHEWSENATGVKTRLNTQDKVVALTLDACGSNYDGFDERIVDFLIEHKIPTTFFICQKWIEKHPFCFAQLPEHDFFAIENHGLNHKPCSVNGKSIYGIPGTQNIDELIEEVEEAAQELTHQTCNKPKFFRSGTAYYDEIAVKVINCLGYEVVGFTILGDAGATYSTEQAYDALKQATPGSIIIAHVNHPERDAGLGIVQGLQYLLNQGFKFVKLTDYKLI